jgi:CAAX protease family protein
MTDPLSTPYATRSPVNWRGIVLYLAICFGLTWGAEIIALALGVRFAVLTKATVIFLALVMFIPAVSAFIVRRWLTCDGFASAGLRLGSWKPYLFVLLGVPFFFFVIYTLTCMFRLGVFTTDPVAALRSLHPLPPGKKVPPAAELIVFFCFISFVAGPFLNFMATFGEEFGWTGYLLPSLLPLGRWRAVGIYGIIWGLWHAPIVAGGFNYPGHPIAGIVFMCLFTTSIGLVQCSLILRYRSVLLTSFLHAAINANARGVWLLVVIGINPLWGGPLGLVGLLVIGSFGIWLLAKSTENSPGVLSVAPDCSAHRETPPHQSEVLPHSR